MPMSKSAAELIAKAPWLSRRNFAKGLAGTGMLAAAGLPARRAAAKTTITWMGWQGYETPITSGTFLADNDIDFQPTFIGSNEEIITKLQAGGIGNTDLITMYFGYLPLMAEGGLLEPVDAGASPLSAISFRSSPRRTPSSMTAVSWACPGTGARCRSCTIHRWSPRRPPPGSM